MFQKGIVFFFKILYHFLGDCGKTVGTPVFSYKDVVSEESSLDGDVLCVTKMVKVCSAMMEIVVKHQFEWMVFPTDLLPMEVSSPKYLETLVIHVNNISYA